jgi:formylglycine-generating enzyme required for sulfatase activity
LSRLFIVTDARGEHRYEASQLPLSVGGGEVADIVAPGCRPDQIIAYVALSDGHAYIQPADPALKLFHNFEHLDFSAWLKSGDQVQLGEAQMHWLVKGDQVHIDLQQAEYKSDLPTLQAPSAPARQVPPLPLVETGIGKTTHHRLKRIALVLFIALLLIAGFVLLATPVSVQIEPLPEQQAVKGFPPPIPLAGRQLLWPGRYRVEAQLDGYFGLDEVIDVPMGGYQNYQFALRERPGLVKVTVTPAVPFQMTVDGEDVTVDDAGVARIERGSRRVRIETQRYLPVEQMLDVLGLGQQQQLTFNLKPAWAEVHIDSRPPGALVRVDGEAVGTTPLDTELLKGEHEIKLELALHKTVTLQQPVEAGQRLDLGEISLSPADGELRLDTSPGEVTVQVDSRFQGTTPLTLTLSSAEAHHLKMTKPGYAPLEQEISLQPEQQLQLQLKLEKQYGTLFITADPADARLRVDGQPMGTATRRLRLPTRAHRLEIFKPGYATYAATVTPQLGVSRNIDVKLKTLQQAKSEAMAATIKTATGQLLHLVRPGAAFSMGASRREAGRRANESRRQVQLTRAFYFAEKEVTNAQYRQFQAAHNSGRAEGVHLDGPEQPVVNISWDDAARFCNWLSKKDGLPPAYQESNGHLQLVQPVNSGYRLPTEAEWAYVARVLKRNKPARYPWDGNYPPSRIVGNFADARIGDTLAVVVPNYDDHYRATAPVGHYAPFPAGFYDLGGNVAEWVNDYYSVYPGEAGQLVKDPTGPTLGEHYVVRGSSWRHGSITELRLSYRDYSRKPRDDLGFRVARYAQ